MVRRTLRLKDGSFLSFIWICLCSASSVASILQMYMKILNSASDGWMPLVNLLPFIILSQGAGFILHVTRCFLVSIWITYISSFGQTVIATGYLMIGRGFPLVTWTLLFPSSLNFSEAFIWSTNKRLVTSLQPCLLYSLVRLIGDLMHCSFLAYSLMFEVICDCFTLFLQACVIFLSLIIRL